MINDGWPEPADARARLTHPSLALLGLIYASCFRHALPLLRFGPEERCEFLGRGAGGLGADRAQALAQIRRLQLPRGVTLDPKNKTVIVSDKYLNAVMTFSLPEIYDRPAARETARAAR